MTRFHVQFWIHPVREFTPTSSGMRSGRSYAIPGHQCDAIDSPVVDSESQMKEIYVNTTIDSHAPIAHAATLTTLNHATSGSFTHALRERYEPRQSLF